MYLHSTVAFMLSIAVGISLAEFNWDYGSWSPITGPCATCFPNLKSLESQSNIHSSFGELNARGRQLKFVQTQPVHIPQADDAENSLDTVQLVYLPEGSLRKLRTAKVARVSETQLRPVRQISFQDIQSLDQAASFQQLPSFISISPKRPTALIAERGKENEAQQHIQLLEAALNAQHDDVKPGELPRVFIAPTHLPPPPGYVKIPLLPSQNSVRTRQSLPSTFLTSEFHNQLPNGFIQLPLPENVAHLSHDIPFVHPDSNPLLLAHFSPASTLRGSSINQRQPIGTTNALKVPVQDLSQFPTSVRGSNQFLTQTNEFNNFQPHVVKSNQLQTSVREGNQFPTPTPELNHVRIAPSSLLRQPDARRPHPSFDEQSSQSQNFGQQPVASSIGFTESNFNFNEGFGNQNVQTISNIAPHTEKQQETDIDFRSDPFIQPNELKVQQQLTPFQQTARQPSHRFQIGAPVIFPTDTFPEEDQPNARDSGFNGNNFNEENQFGFQEENINTVDTSQQLPTQKLPLLPVSSEPQLLNEQLAQLHPLADESHFLTTDATVVEFEESNQALKPIHETHLNEDNFDDTSNFRLSPKPVLSSPTTESPDSNPSTNDFEHQQTTSQLPELLPPTTSFIEEKDLETPIVPEIPARVRNRGRKRIRPESARGRGRHLNRNKLNLIPNEEKSKEIIQFSTIIPNDTQIDHSQDDTITSAPVRLTTSRSRIPARRPRPNQQRVTPSKPEASDAAAAVEESTLFPPFSVARQQSSLNEEDATAEVVPKHRKDSSLLRGRFGSRMRSRIQEANEEKPNSESTKSENVVTDETLPNTFTGGRNQVAIEQTGVRNVGRPVPEWLKNRRRTRVLSRVRKVNPSNSASADTASDVPESLTREVDLKGAESARFSVSRVFGENLPIPNEQTLSKNQKVEDETKTRFEIFQTENVELALDHTELPTVLEVETTTENKFEDILDIFHLESATDETPIEVVTFTFFNENENLPVVELQEDISEQKIEEGYVDYVSNQSNPVELDSFSQNRDELENSSRTDKLEESASNSSSFDTIIDFVSHSSTNSKPQISSSFITSNMKSSDVSQNFESKDSEVEDPHDNYFDNFFDVSSTDENPRLPSNVNDGENLSGNGSYIGSSAHIIYAVALNEAPKENSLFDTSKNNTLVNSKEANKPLESDYEAPNEENIESTTALTDDKLNEPKEIKELSVEDIKTLQASPLIETPSNTSTLNFLESFFSNKSRPSTDFDNEVHEFKTDGQTVIGSSTITEVRSSAPVICFSEGNCVIGTGLRKKRNS